MLPQESAVAKLVTTNEKADRVNDRPSDQAQGDSGLEPAAILNRFNERAHHLGALHSR